MREAMITIHRVTGIAAIDSPWIAVLQIFIASAVLLYLCGRWLLHIRRTYSNRPALRALSSVLILIVVVGAFLTTAGILSVVRFGAGVQNYDPFTIYWTVLFLLANAPFWLVLWRGGLFKNVQPNP